MDEGDTLVNAVLGGVVSFLTGNFVPFAPVLGGVVAGYLEGGTRRDGVRVGALTGLIAFVPVMAVAIVISSVLGIVGLGFGLGIFGSGIPGLGAAGLLGIVFLLFLLALAFVYLVGGGALGGWLGNYVKYETDVDV